MDEDLGRSVIGGPLPAQYMLFNLQIVDIDIYSERKIARQVVANFLYQVE
jgi:hypothetical protein